MTLGEEQRLFTRLTEKLFQKIHETHEFTYGDTTSNPEFRIHSANSCHYIRLAIDINLFDKSGAFLTTTEAHKPFGDYWKSLHPLCRWGGDFKNKDGNHYSMDFQGRM